MIQLLLWLAIAAIAVPMLVFAVQCFAASLSPRTPRPLSTHRPPTTILIPAHDEETGIQATLDSLLPQLQPGDSIVVVADNCTDRTAELARLRGVTVIERTDLTLRGKSYALDFGIRWLAQAPPAVLVIVDADCTVHPGALDHLVRLAQASRLPVQCTYVMHAPTSNDSRYALSVLAFTVKNLVRPAGWDRCGFPCFLNGSGMAFPWPAIAATAFDSGRIAEDKWLTVDLALHGHPPLFTPHALVTSVFPVDERARASQRFRWEHGHLETLTRQGPRLLLAAVRNRSPRLLALALELCVPPLSLLIVLCCILGVVAIILGFYSAVWMPAIAVLSLSVFSALSLAAALRQLGSPVPFQSLLHAPAYAIGKMPLYAAYLLRRQRTWVRTGRDSRNHGPVE